MRTALKPLAAFLFLQVLFLAGLLATDFVAPPSARLIHLQVKPPIVTDDTSECGAQSIGLELDASPLRHAIVAARPIGKNVDKTTCQALLEVANGNDSEIVWFPLERYWHGYRVVIDPLTALFSWRVVQFLMMGLLGVALAYFATGSAALVGWSATVMLLVPTLALTDFRYLWLQTGSSVATCFIFAGAGWFARRLREGGDLLVPSLVMGSIFNYFDLLTNPPWQPMLLAFFVLAAGRGARSMAAVLVCWLAGYALTWATKWGLAIVYGGDWNYIWETILFRLGGSADRFVLDHRPLASSAMVIRELVGTHRYSLIAVIAVIALIAWLAISVRRVDLRRSALLALIPFLWFETLRNHTQIHAWFVYRPVATSIGIVLAAWALAGRKNEAVSG